MAVSGRVIIGLGVLVAIGIVVLIIFAAAPRIELPRQGAGSTTPVAQLPQRSPADWQVRKTAGLRILSPGEFRAADPPKSSLPMTERDKRVEQAVIERSEAVESVGGGFYLVVIHTVDRGTIARDLEKAAWVSVEKLNPVLVPESAHKTVRQADFAGVSGFRSSSPIINRGFPGRFEAAVFGSDRDFWLVSIMVTSPDDEDLLQIERIFDSLAVTEE